ncbi:MAG: 3-oxoacyl-ACP reductase [Phenylobacterium sp.]|nr:3-oxoacyl-ACP reductase [Phenylobacterium sp.]
MPGETTAGRRLEGRRVLITGAASGIGKATAELCAREGAALALMDINAQGLAPVAEALGAKAFPADLRDQAGLASAVDACAEALGGLDGVVNCAGVNVSGALGGLTPADWQLALDVNLTAPFLICQAALRRMGPGASIVNVSSGMGLRPDAPNVSAYAASKGGLIAFTKALAAEFAPDIRANVVCPGLTATPMTAHMLGNDPASSPAANRYALKRPADPSEIANAILFLLSDEASYVTGIIVAADGGRTFH